MKKILFNVTVCMIIVCLSNMTVFAQEYEVITTEYKGASNVKMSVIGHYDSGSGEGGTEIVAYAKSAKKLFVVNGEEKALDISDISSLEPGKITTFKSTKRIHLDDFNGTESAGDITSVAISKDEEFVAVCVPAEVKYNDGSLVLIDLEGNHIATYKVGALPDMVKITDDGNYILVANEGEPSNDYTIDPEGSVTVIDISNGLTSATVNNVLFDDESIIDESIRKSNINKTYAESLEPEYIDVTEDSKTAYVVCQESNAIAVLDIQSLKFTRVYDLGVKDYSIEGNEIDASNKDDKINFSTYPVLSFYQPDGIDLANINGKSYLFTANEGDAQDYSDDGGYCEEVRVGDIVDNIKLDASNYAGYTQEELDSLVLNGLFEKANLGRLKVTIADGQNTDGVYDTLYGFGGRSFSIYDAETMKQVYDSNNDFETITSKVSSQYFNTTNDELAFDDRSDDKGPEPENVVVGNVGNDTYAFIGLERFGGVMCYDVSDVENPVFELYTTTRQFDESAGGDLAPEGMFFVEADNSITTNPLLLVANEVSGTVVIYEITENIADTNNTINSETNSETNNTTDFENYTIKKGDVLWKIARNHGVTWQELAEVNNIKNPNLIYENDVILIP